MEHFNPPPSWPAPPAGWRPVPGWQPEAHWPPAPSNWNFWVDDRGYPVTGPPDLYGSKDMTNDPTYGVMPGEQAYRSDATVVMPYRSGAGASEPTVAMNSDRYARGGAPVLAEGRGSDGSSAASGSSAAKKGAGCLTVGVVALALMGACHVLTGGGSSKPAPSVTPSSSSSSSATPSSASTSSSLSSSATPSPTSTATTQSSTPEPTSSTPAATPAPSPSSSVLTTPAPSVSTPRTTTTQAPQGFVGQQPSPQARAYYRSCDDARAAGVAPLHVGDPGYSRKLDRDGDGVACE